VTLSADAGATVAKIAPPAVALTFPERLWALFDPVMLLALVVGLLAGVLWRAGDARKRGHAWEGIRNDLAVSCLIGLANLVMAAIVVHGTGVPPLYAIGVAMIIAGKGPDAMVWFERRFIGNSPAVPQAAQSGLDGTPAAPNSDLEALTKKLDGK